MRATPIGLLIALALLVPATAGAEEPEYIEEFQGNLVNCRPSCYDNEPGARWDASDYKRVCGYKDWSFTSMRVGGRWTPLESRGIPAVDPSQTSCKLPGSSGGKWKSLVKQAARAFKPLAGDLAKLRYVVRGGWAHSRDAYGKPVRTLTVRIYSSNWGLKPNECGAHGNTVCEPSGSKTAKAINYVRYRLDEAKKYADSNEEACRVSSFAAVATARGVRKFRDHLKRKKTWAEGLTYKTRYDGSLSEKAVFKRIDAYEKEALALHKRCGGASPLVTAVRDTITRTEPEFAVVPNPADD
jgi:hypothetical protein